MQNTSIEGKETFIYESRFGHLDEAEQELFLVSKVYKSA